MPPRFFWFCEKGPACMPQSTSSMLSVQVQHDLDLLHQMLLYAFKLASIRNFIKKKCLPWIKNVGLQFETILLLTCGKHVADIYYNK